MPRNCTELVSMASISMPYSRHVAWERYERTRKLDACQRQERNGKAAHGQVGKNSETEPSDQANFTTARYCRSLDEASDADHLTTSLRLFEPPLANEHPHGKSLAIQLPSQAATAMRRNRPFRVTPILIFNFNVLSVVMGQLHVAC
jgi:hypothetical protein